MKLTKQDIKTLEKIRKMCDKIKCEECPFNARCGCILQNQPNWWELEVIRDDK